MPRKGVKLSDEAKAKNAEATARWHKENTEALSVRVRREQANAYRQLAKIRGQSLTSIIRDYLEDECKKEGISTESD